MWPSWLNFAPLQPILIQPDPAFKAGVSACYSSSQNLSRASDFTQSGSQRPWTRVPALDHLVPHSTSAIPSPALLLLTPFSQPWPPGCSQTQNLLPQGLCMCLETSPGLQSPSPMGLTLWSFKSFLKSHLQKEGFLWPSYLKLQPSPSLYFHALTMLNLFILIFSFFLPLFLLLFIFTLRI